MPVSDFNTEAMLAFVSELDKRVGDLKKEISSLGDMSGVSMKKAGAETEKFGEALEKNIKPIKGMRDQSGGLTRTLTGLGGIGAAFYSASKAMDQFAISGLQSRNLAMDLGLTTAAVGNFKTQLSAAGIDGKTAAAQLGALTSKLDNLKTYGTASAVYKAIAANDPVLADRLLQAERAGDRLKSLQWIKERWAQPGEPRSKLYLSETLGVNPSTMAALLRNQEGLIQPRSSSKDELEEYNISTTNMMTLTANIWGDAMMFMVRDSNKFIEATKKEFNAASSWLQNLQDQFIGKKEGIVFGEKQGILPSQKEWIDLWEGIKKAFTPSKAQAAEIERTPGDEVPLPTEEEQPIDRSTFGQRFGEWQPPHSQIDANVFREKFDVSKDANATLVDIRELLREASGGPAGVAGAGFGGGGGGTGPGGTTTSEQGGPVRVLDEAGKPIDQETMKLAESLGRNGDTKGLERLFQQRGYRMSGAACGIVASKYARAAGFAPPKGGAIATWWHKWGESAKADDVNAPGRPFGSMMGTYWHRRYGGDRNQVLAPGQTGGHVMTIVPGSYNPKDGTVGIVDQYGFQRRSIKDIDFRYAGDQAVREADRIRSGRPPVDEARKKIDSSAPSLQNRGARIDVEVNGAPKGVTTNAELLDQGVFNNLNVRNNPAPIRPALGAGPN